MRKLIAAIVPIGLLAACSGPARMQETATSVPPRDLTLSTAAVPSVEVASKIELFAEPQALRSPPSRRARPVRVAPEPEPAVVAAAPAAVSEPAPLPAPPVAEAPQHDSRELAPGATVMVIPASTTSSAGTGGDWSEVPGPRTRGTGIIMGGGHAGKCGRGGGRGPVSILK